MNKTVQHFSFKFQHKNYLERSGNNYRKDIVVIVNCIKRLTNGKTENTPFWLSAHFILLGNSLFVSSILRTLTLRCSLQTIFKSDLKQSFC